MRESVKFRNLVDHWRHNVFRGLEDLAEELISPELGVGDGSVQHSHLSLTAPLLCCRRVLVSHPQKAAHRVRLAGTIAKERNMNFLASLLRMPHQ